MSSRSQSNSKDSLGKSASRNSSVGTTPKSFYWNKSKNLSKSNNLDYPDITVQNEGTLNGGYQRMYSPSEDHQGYLGGLKNWFNKSIFGYQPLSSRKPSDVVDINKNKLRKVPVKVEPKVFFANERTFLSWLNMSVTLASISIAILAFAEHNKYSQTYGLILLPVAIAFCVYALFTYIKRAGMIRRKEPGPYEDKIGPVVLTVLLVSSILIQFAFKAVDFYQKRTGKD